MGNQRVLTIDGKILQVENSYVTATSVLTADEAIRAQQDRLGNYIDAEYETKVDAQQKFIEAQEYSDNQLNNFINGPEMSSMSSTIGANAAHIAEIQEILKNKSNDEHEHNYAGAATPGGAALAVAGGQESSNGNRPVWFSSLADYDHKSYNNNFQYNPGTGTLSVDKITGTAGGLRKQLHFTVGGSYKGAFDGTEDKFIDVNAVDLNLSTALSFLGIVTEEPISAQVTLINGNTVEAVAGNVVILQSTGAEFFFDGTSWVGLGPSDSYSIADHFHGNISNNGALKNSINQVVISDENGMVSGSSITTNELNCLQGANQNIQEQLNRMSFDDHTHLYAGSASEGGPASSAIQLQNTVNINGINFNGTNNIYNYGVCYTEAATAAKTVEIPNFQLAVGAQIAVKFTNANGSDAGITLNVSGTGAKPIYRYGTTALSGNTTLSGGGWVAGAVLIFIYDGIGWIEHYWSNSTYYISNVHCNTAGDTAAKVGTTSQYTLANNKYFMIMMYYDNSAASALTLNINSQGAKPIYINGAPSSTSNYTLPKGIYKVYYNGTGYFFSTADNDYVGNLVATGSGYFGSGSVEIRRNTSIAANNPAQLIFTVVQSDNSTSSVGSIKVYDDHDTAAYGTNMVIQSAGNMIIGSGEAPNACYTTDLVDNTSENTYVVSDGSIYFYTNCNTYSSAKKTVYINTSGVLYGAAWNDYAEFRECDAKIEPGRCIVENGDDTLSLSTARLQRGANIVSDTFGFAIGETEKANTPIAVSGRVLCHIYEGREKAKDFIGWPVCSGPNGTVSIMTEEEEMKYPSRIIGTISAVPEYDTWGEDNIAVNGRIWIKIK